MWVYELAQDRDRWRTLVSAVMNLWVRKVGNFLTSCKPVSLSRRTLHHGVSKTFLAWIIAYPISLHNCHFYSGMEVYVSLNGKMMRGFKSSVSRALNTKALITKTHL